MNHLSTRSDQNAHYHELVARYFSAYQKRERTSVEKMFTDNFTFTNFSKERIARDRFFEKTWPTGGHVKKVHIQELVANGDEAFVLCETEPFEGERFVTTEIFTFKDDRISSIESFLGTPIFG